MSNVFILNMLFTNYITMVKETVKVILIMLQF